MKKNLSRRKFLGLSGLAAGTAWVSLSDFWAPRYVREAISDLTEPILKPKFTPEPLKWDDNAITASWLGHATVLLNFYGVKIITDPVMMSRVGVDIGLTSLGPKRRFGCPLSVKDLPKIDLVLLSHAHLDHFDIPTLRTFKAGTKVITAKNTSDLFSGTALGKTAKELTWGETATVETANGSVEVEAVQVKHWGARWRHDTHRGFNGYVLSRGGKRVLFGGDTAMIDTFKPLRSKGPIELACMPIGAYNPWIWSHCNPEQAVQMANDAGAKYFIPMHHSTFRFGREKYTEPMERCEGAFRSETERLAVREAGETFVTPA
ncbi:MAG TPA: MBL fold metallo-hydrolase [Methylomirabilota bacterium]|nr:MBL fold metallo-hydrolase [Methylomirabilota bacterium]